MHSHRTGSGPAPWSALIVCRRGGQGQRNLSLVRHGGGREGISDAWAAAVVAVMAGPHRIPTAVKRVDGLARGLARPVEAQ